MFGRGHCGVSRGHLGLGAVLVVRGGAAICLISGAMLISCEAVCLENRLVKYRPELIFLIRVLFLIMPMYSMHPKENFNFLVQTVFGENNGKTILIFFLLL